MTLINALRKKSLMCKICLEDDKSDNPLIRTCKCKGSMKYVHLMCIRNWLKSRVITRNHGFLMVHLIKSLDCELCKTKIPGNATSLLNI